MFFLSTFHICYWYNLCVVGGSSGLGKEIIYQGINNFNMNVIALTSTKDKIYIPYRGNTFEEIETCKKFESNKLKIFEYKLDKDNLIPFKLN